MESLVKSIEKHQDKDKLIAVIQHLSQLISLTVKNIHPQMSQNFNAFFRFVGGSRKMFLFGTSLCLVPPILHLASKENGLSTHFLDIASLIGKFSFFLFDNIQLMSGMKVLPFNRSTFDSLAVMSIISSLLIDLGRNVYKLYCLLDEKEAKQSKNEVDAELNSKVFNTFLETTAVFGELLALLNYSGLLRMAAGHHSMLIGTLGGLWSGIIGFLATYSNVSKSLKPKLSSNNNNPLESIS